MPCFVALFSVVLTVRLSVFGATIMALVVASLPMRRLLALVRSTRRRVDVVETLEVVGDMCVLLYVVSFIVVVMSYMMRGLGHDRAMITLTVLLSGARS